jgi:hypothetical protein
VKIGLSLSLSLSEEKNLKGFENTLPRRIFGHKRHEIRRIENET